MILRNGEHPRGIDLGPARNSFMIGRGARTSAASAVARRLYGNHKNRRREPEFVALIAAIASQAITDARAGQFASKDIVEMVPAYRDDRGLQEGDPVDLEDVADWLRTDARDWLQAFGIRIEAIDHRELVDAKNALLSQMQHEPVIRKVA